MHSALLLITPSTNCVDLGDTFARDSSIFDEVVLVHTNEGSHQKIFIFADLDAAMVVQENSPLAPPEQKGHPQNEMPLLSISSQVTIAKCAALPLNATDIFICSYPKSGTTWLQHIVLSLLFAHQEKTTTTHRSIDNDSNESASSPQSPPYEHVSDFAPFFEIDPHWEGDQLAAHIQDNHRRIGRRIFNTHLRLDMLPSVITSFDYNHTHGGDNLDLDRGRHKRGKFIYIVRSPLDTCVSFFHHLSHQVEGGYEGDLDTFFQQWLDGSLAYGSWADHVSSYAKALANGWRMDDVASTTGSIRLDDGREIMVLLYEDMVKDVSKAVTLLVNFLELDVSFERQAELVPTFLFANMKANIERFQPKSVQWSHQFSFLRRGQCGDGSSSLSEQQRVAFRQHVMTHQLEPMLAQSPSPALRKLAALI